MNGFETITRLGGYILPVFDPVCLYQALLECRGNDRISVSGCPGTYNRTSSACKIRPVSCFQISLLHAHGCFWRSLYSRADKKSSSQRSFCSALYFCKMPQRSNYCYLCLSFPQGRLTAHPPPESVHCRDRFR